ncbi:enhanced serine sensitivity protein SseB [Streptomyces sulfonofaciens]|uniref:Enhanced serine sensitivity protein SseB n=1 Tax=Streptomyces sulfonofaciens TaxID=68272 RepID=A0A919L1P6_9ACTN|nr:enhanced serine sensitivity protein SseB [Streptomyces sulfonofaciens]GHH80623.1 enhanced serine sensitivity protein SseB [Streptomyces sulfonofaciens]
MDTAPQAMTHPHGGWPANELEEVLAASLDAPWGHLSGPSGTGGVSSAGARILEVLTRSAFWVPLPGGGGPHQPVLDLPTIELEGQAYIPVFSSEQQFRAVVGDHMGYTVAPAVEFARGLPPQLGIAVNPDGAVGIPLPPPAVAELCRAGRSPLDGTAAGGRVRLFQPDWQEDPVDFLSAAAEEFAVTGAAPGAGIAPQPAAPGAGPLPGTVLSARRCLASIEGDDPVLFIGVELTPWEGDGRAAPLAALGRALGRVPVRWPVNLVLLDVTQDPVAEWMREKVAPFYTCAP